jgi:hypothetical protein
MAYSQFLWREKNKLVSLFRKLWRVPLKKPGSLKDARADMAWADKCHAEWNDRHGILNCRDAIRATTMAGDVFHDTIFQEEAGGQ